MSQYSLCVYAMIIQSQLTPTVHCVVMINNMLRSMLPDLTVTFIMKLSITGHVCIFFTCFLTMNHRNCISPCIVKLVSSILNSTNSHIILQYIVRCL
jgi:hypothetical protein